jgi:hypothetical protein
MKIKVNTKILEALNPCEDGLAHWKEHCNDFSGDVVEFLDLPNITWKDKIWVACRLLPRLLVEVFAFDCSLEADVALAFASSDAYADFYAASYDSDSASAFASSVAFAASDSSTYSAYARAAAAASTYAAYTSAYVSAAAASKEQQRQIESLIYLIQTTSEKELKGL